MKVAGIRLCARRSTVLLVAASLLASSSSALQFQPGTPALHDGRIPEELVTHEHNGWRPTAVAENFRQSFSFSGGHSKLLITRHERADRSTPFGEPQQLVFSTDLKITDVTFCGGGNDFFVAGVRTTTAGCEDVIERWTLQLPQGAYRATCGAATQPRGTPMPMPFAAQLSTAVVGGGAFVPIAQRERRQPAMVKSVLFAGDAGIISALEADPEGRFLLAQTYATRDVYSIDLTGPGAVPALEISASEFPQMTNIQNIVVYEHTTKGRLYAFKEGSKHGGPVPLGARYMYARDADNDGVFDGYDVMDAAAFKASEYFGNALYTSLVNTGVSTP